jgi:hypothetical protein
MGLRLMLPFFTEPGTFSRTSREGDANCTALIEVRENEPGSVR